MDERSARIAKRFDLPILVAALLVVPTVAVEQSHLGGSWRSAAAVANWAIWLAFATEVVVMLSVVPHRWRWLREHPIEVFIVLATPPFVPFGLQGARALRLLRLLRLLRIAPLARRTFSLSGLRYVAVLALLTVLVGGAAFAAAEPHTSTWDGIWWAVNTMTTLGYGGPVTTNLGRVITIALLAVGVGNPLRLGVGRPVQFSLKRAQVGVRGEVLQLPSDLGLLGFGPAAPHGVTPSCVCRDGIAYIEAPKWRLDSTERSRESRIS